MNQDSHWDYTVREWESPKFMELLKEAFSQPVEVVYDVGACVGGWSAVVNRYFPGKEIYAFEPFPDNFKALMTHTAETNAITLPFGIWYGKDEAKAMWRGSNIGAIFIDEVDTTMAHDTHEVFKLKTFEELDLPKPDLIKFDVEGAEKNIFEHSTMLKTVPQLIVEWHFVGQQDAKEFFAKHLPHKVISNIDEGMFLLRL